jgi:hypothetical protein
MPVEGASSGPTVGPAPATIKEALTDKYDLTHARAAVEEAGTKTDPSEAADVFLQFLAEHPEPHNVLHVASDLMHKLTKAGRYEEALEWGDRAIELAGDHPSGDVHRMNKITALTEMGDLEGAHAAVDALVAMPLPEHATEWQEVVPRIFMAPMYRAELLRKAGDYAAAEAQLREVVASVEEVTTENPAAASLARYGAFAYSGIINMALEQSPPNVQQAREALEEYRVYHRPSMISPEELLTEIEQAEEQWAAQQAAGEKRGA